MHKNVSIRNVKRLLTVAEMRGYCANELLKFTGLKPAILEQDTLSAEIYSRLYNSIIILLQDESLGFYGHHTVPPGTFKTLCYCVISSRSLREAIERIYDFTHLFCQLKYDQPITTLAIEHSDDGQYVIVNLPSMAIPNSSNTLRQATRASMLSGLHQFLNWLTDSYIPLDGVMLNGKAKINLEKYRAIFDCTISFDAERDALMFNKALLTRKIKQSSDTLDDFLSIAPSFMIAERESDASEKTIASIVDSLFQNNTEHLPTLPQCAQLLNISERTLKRRLQESGQSFQQLKDNFRKRMASSYLINTDLSNSEIALLIGFCDTRQFYKTFRKWYNMTPKAYRDRAIDGN